MKSVDADEFRDHAMEYLAGDETLTIVRHGQPIGTYIPRAAERPKRLELPRVADDPERRRAFQESSARLDQMIRQLMEETGWTEEEWDRFWDLNVPESEWPEPRRRRDGAAGATDV